MLVATSPILFLYRVINAKLADLINPNTHFFHEKMTLAKRVLLAAGLFGAAWVANKVHPVVRAEVRWATPRRLETTRPFRLRDLSLQEAKMRQTLVAMEVVGQRADEKPSPPERTELDFLLSSILYALEKHKEDVNFNPVLADAFSEEREKAMLTDACAACILTGDLRLDCELTINQPPNGEAPEAHGSDTCLRAWRTLWPLVSFYYPDCGCWIDCQCESDSNLTFLIKVQQAAASRQRATPT